MSRFLLVAALLLPACTPAAVTRTAPASPDVPVERVILFTSGVGYFEHAGQVRGDAEVVLQFDEAALNDVLKSLVVEDAQGRVAGVVYPTQAPLERALRSFAIDLSGQPGLPAILAQARGAGVRVEARTGTVRGTLLAVGAAEQIDAPPVSTVTLSTDRGLVTVRLDDVRRIAFTDPAVQAEIDAALASLAEARGGQRRPVRVQLQGDAERRVRLGYVVEAPVWKTSYRLILPDSPEATDGALQGWALVENPTEADWAGVDLTLVSGRPVSFITDLYTPRYVERPVVVLHDDAVVRPREYAEGALARGAGAVAPPPPAAAPVMESDAADLNTRGGRSAEAQYFADGVAVSALDPTAGFQASAQAGDFGELFAYRLGGVTLPRRASAMLPIVGAGVPAERLSVYSGGGSGRHPMRGVRLRNTTGANLRGGPMTVLDDGYAGDAVLPDLPAGTQRLLTFALDQDVLVDPFAVPGAPGRIETATLRDGVLTLRRQRLTTAGYRIENRGARARTVLVETRRDPGADLVAPSAADETTPDLYRVRAVVAPGAVDTLVVRQSRTTDERVVLASVSPEALAQIARADGDLPAGVRRALGDAVDAGRALAETRRAVQTLDREARDIRQDQERVRGNLQAVDNGSAYGRRLLRRLDEQETRLDAIDGDRAALTARAEAQERALRVTVR